MIDRIRAWWARWSSGAFKRDTPAETPAARHVAFVRDTQQLLTTWHELFGFVDAGDAPETRDRVRQLWPAGWSELRDVDGIEGPRTRSAARAFAVAWNALGLQCRVRDDGVRDDGVLDAELLQALRDDIERRIEHAG